jgi:hypothetical protein
VNDPNPLITLNNGVQMPAPSWQKTMAIAAAKVEHVPDDAGSHFPGVCDVTPGGIGVVPGSDIPDGYVEEEYFVSGEADGHPYRTTLLVRKPTDPNVFSGVVLYETVRTTGHAAMWIYLNPLLMRGQRHAYAMVCSQRVGLEETVKPHDPDRYAGLDIELPDGTELPPVPPEFAGRLAARMQSPRARQLIAADHAMELEQREDALATPISNAIMGQVGRMLKSSLPDGPFAGLDVRYLILGGASQTGATTLRFMRDAHDGARMADGSYVVDGFFPAASALYEPVGAIGVPVIHVLAELDLLMADRAKSYRRDDRDAPGDQFRLYELAGAAHFPTRGLKDLGSVSAFSAMPDVGGELSQLPSPYFYDAALENLVEWVTKGTKPPYGARIEIDEDGEIVRDEHGNARGGVRLSQLEVPAAAYLSAPVFKDADEPWLVGMFGIEEPFSAETLRTLYRDHDDYVTKVEASLEHLVADRWLVREPPEAPLHQATAAPIP